MLLCDYVYHGGPIYVPLYISQLGSQYILILAEEWLFRFALEISSNIMGLVTHGGGLMMMLAGPYYHVCMYIYLYNYPLYIYIYTVYIHIHIYIPVYPL